MDRKVKDLILKKYNIKRDVIEIPNVGRDDLVELLFELNVKTGAEIGVAAGDYSLEIMEANPQIKIMYGVDPYAPYKGYKDFKKLGTFDKLEQAAHDKLDKFAPNYEFVKKFSDEAAEDFIDESLDFVYIDANHSEPYVSQDINLWAEKVKPGGIVAGHDYARIKAKGVEDSTNWAVIPAIKKYAKEHGYELFIWGLEAKIGNLKREGSRSWMFVKK